MSYQYDENKRLLRIRMRDLPEPLDVDILQETFASYKHYLDVTVREDVELLVSRISAKVQRNIEIKSFSIDPNFGGNLGQPMNDESKAYLVHVTLSADGVNYSNIEIFRVPYMDNLGCLAGNFLVHSILRLEELTYSEKDKTLTLVFPRYSVTFGESASNVFTFGLGKSKKLDFYSMLAAFLIESGTCSEANVNQYLRDTYCNPLVRNVLNKNYYKFPRTVMIEADTFAGGAGNFYKYITSDAFRLEKTRVCLDKHFSLDKALGLRLADPCYIERYNLTLPKGTLINEEALLMLKRGFVRRVVVDYVPHLELKELDREICITQVPAGTPMTMLRETFPGFENMEFVPYDSPCDIVFPVGTVLSRDILILLQHCKVEEVLIKNCKVPYVFKHEILSNYTISLRDLLPEFEGNDLYNVDTCVYIPTVKKYMNNLTAALSKPELYSEFVQEHLTSYDIEALVNFRVGIITMPDVFQAYERDVDFVKKVQDVDSALSFYFRSTIDRFVTLRGSALNDLFAGRIAGTKANEIFYTFRKQVRLRMNEDHVLRRADYTNPASLIAGVRQIVTVAKNASTPQRALVMGHFGRLDPYETPAGKKLGLVSSLPCYARIVSGQPEVAYYPIIHRGDQSFISPRIVWLTQLEEFGHRFGDIMSIHTKGDLFSTPIIPEYVPARVPASAGSDERITADSVLSTHLDYITVSPEQTLGVTAMLIPFIGSDDGVRVSYACSMIKQAIQLQHSEVPYVLTGMYDRMFQEDSTYVVRAPFDGTVKEVLDTCIITTDEQVIDVGKTQIHPKSVITLNFLVHAGDSFKKGDILADTVMSREGYFTPGTNLIVAYMHFYGYNYEDAVPLSQAGAEKLVSLDVSIVSKELPPEEKGESRSITLSPQSYIHSGDEVFRIGKEELNSRQRSDPTRVFAPAGKSGIIHPTSPVHTDDSIKYGAILIDQPELHVGDKVAGRHGNKSTDAKIFKNSEFPMFPNGVVVDIIQNPCGIPSRMNVGQQLESHLGFVGYLLDIRIRSDAFNGATREDIRELWEFVYDFANAPTREAAEQLVPKWSKRLPKSLVERALSRYFNLRKWAGCFTPDGCGRLINQKTGKEFKNPIAFGVGYYMKLEHQSAHKHAARAGVLNSEYTMIEKQPQSGNAKGGGQRLGEMEFDAIHATGSAQFSAECLNEKSDNVLMRERLIPVMNDEGLQTDIDLDRSGTAPRGAELLAYYLEACGILATYDNGYPLTLQSVRRRRRVGQIKAPVKHSKEVKDTYEDILGDLDEFADDTPEAAVEDEPIVEVPTLPGFENLHPVVLDQPKPDEGVITAPRISTNADESDV